MQKALIIADLHIHPTPEWRFEWLEVFVDQILEDQATKYKGFDLILAGDVLESRDNVFSKCLNLMIKLMSGWEQGAVIWITGQHDSYVPGRATLEALDGVRNIRIVDRAVYHDTKSDIWYVPFARKLEDYRKMLDEVPDDVVVFTHMPVVEIMEELGAKNVDGIRVAEFSRFRHTYSGDIHKYKDYPKLSYVGAPSQRDWRDKGVCGVIATLVDGNFTRIEVDHPIHIEVESEKDLPEGKKCIVRTRRGFQVAEHHNILGATTKVELKPNSVKINTESESSVISEYVKKNPLKTVKPERVEAYARTTLKEAEVA